MALISCPECGRQISDRAPACPGCGILIEDIRMLLNQKDMQTNTFASVSDNNFYSVFASEADSQPSLNVCNAELDNKHVKCLHCNNNYIASDLKCPKCNYPLLVFTPDARKFGKDVRNAVQHTGNYGLERKRIKCVICTNEYMSTDIKCPKCKFPALAFTADLNKQDRIIQSYKRDNGFGYKGTASSLISNEIPNNTESLEEINEQISKKKKTIASIEETIENLKNFGKGDVDSAIRLRDKNQKELQELIKKANSIGNVTGKITNTRNSTNQPRQTTDSFKKNSNTGNIATEIEPIPEITKKIIESEKEFFTEYSGKDYFIRNMNKILGILGSNWKEYSPKNADELIVPKNDDIMRYKWNFRNKLSDAYRRSDKNNGWIGNYYYSWSLIYPYYSYNLVKLDKHLALMKEDGYEVKLIERKDVLHILSSSGGLHAGKGDFIERTVNRLSEDYTFPKGSDIVEYELAHLMMRTLFDTAIKQRNTISEINNQSIQPQERSNNKSNISTDLQRIKELDQEISDLEQLIAGLEKQDNGKSQSAQSKKVDIGELRRKAVKGDCSSMIELADLYFSGNGVAQNKEETRMWYKKAADNGSVIGKEKYEKAFQQIDKKKSKTTKAAALDFKISDNKDKKTMTLDEIVKALEEYTVVNGKLVRREEAERQSNKKRK